MWIQLQRGQVSVTYLCSTVYNRTTMLSKCHKTTGSWFSPVDEWIRATFNLKVVAYCVNSVSVRAKFDAAASVIFKGGFFKLIICHMCFTWLKTFFQREILGVLSSWQTLVSVSFDAYIRISFSGSVSSYSHLNVSFTISTMTVWFFSKGKFVTDIDQNYTQFLISSFCDGQFSRPAHHSKTTAWRFKARRR